MSCYLISRSNEDVKLDSLVVTVSKAHWDLGDRGQSPPLEGRVCAFVPSVAPVGFGRVYGQST